MPLKDLADVYRGYSTKPDERLKNGPYFLLTGRNIQGLRLELADQDYYVDRLEKPSFRRSIVKEGDILVSVLFEERKLYIFKPDDPPAVAADSLAIIRPRADLFLRDYLNTSTGRERFLQSAARKTHGTIVDRIRIRDLREIRIPLLEPSEIQDLVDDQLSLVGNELQSIIGRGESTSQEFKSTLRYNLHSGRSDSQIENAVLKTIAAFCNTDGGILIIGVKDDGQIQGIEADDFKNTDRFSLHLSNLIKNRFQPSPLEYVKYRIVVYSRRSVCIVECKRADRDIWFCPKGNSPPELYVRVGPSSRALMGPEITDYCRRHFRER